MPRPLRLVLVLIAIAILGWIDYATGPDYGFSLFYLIPIVIVGWTGVSADAMIAAVAASIAWLVADYFAFHAALVVTLWNGFTRMAIFVAMGVMMSRLRAERERLERSNEELESFTYSVSHDLRAPLVHIGSFAAKLDKRTAGQTDDESRRYVKTISDSASEALKLIDDLLEFSRLGRKDVRHSPVDLNEIVASVRAETEHGLNGRQVNWIVHPLPMVRGDAAMIRVVMQNLISNAVKYTGRSDAPTIEIGGREESGSNVVFVRDNGVGFDPQYSSKLFRVFERLHDRDEFDGMGIGLAIAHRVVTRHSGRIWAEGAVDRGATFYVALPA
jgi:light-regulated signal transduction histidine kinase (bacteriophytochrome)